MRQRVDLGPLPQWEGPVQGWARKFIYKNRWRCDQIYEIEDLMQDAYLVFLKVQDRYPAVWEPAHFMSLYKTALLNEFHNYARSTKDRNEVTVDSEAEVPEYTNWGEVASLLAKAPEELLKTLAVFSDAAKLVELNYEPKRPRFSRKNLVPHENLNAKLSRLAGLDCNYDVLTAIRRLFA